MKTLITVVILIALCLFLGAAHIFSSQNRVFLESGVEESLVLFHANGADSFCFFGFQEGRTFRVESVLPLDVGGLQEVTSFQMDRCLSLNAFGFGSFSARIDLGGRVFDADMRGNRLAFVVKLRLDGDRVRLRPYFRPIRTY